MEKKQYALNLAATKDDLIAAGFTERFGVFNLKKPVYGRGAINLIINIDQGIFMNIAVADPVGNTYAPFLNPDLQHNNLVCDKVIHQYNKIMDGLAKKKIVKRIREERKMTDSKTIKIKYFTDKIEKLDYIGGKSDWIDLRAAETVKLKKGEYKLISLGVAMQLPAGYEAHIAPRSSTFKNFGVIQCNSVGVVDSSFCGPSDQWCFPAYALRDTVIHENERICQFRIIENQPKVKFETVEELDAPDRGGWGSTGKQ